MDKTECPCGHQEGGIWRTNGSKLCSGSQRRIRDHAAKLLPSPGAVRIHKCHREQFATGCYGGNETWRRWIAALRQLCGDAASNCPCNHQQSTGTVSVHTDALESSAK